MVELEGGDVGSAHDFVVGVHVAAHAVSAWVLYLRWGVSRCSFTTARDGGGDA